MGLLCKFQQILSRSGFLTIYKTFIRSRLDYADIIYDQAYNCAIHDKLGSIQYNARLAIIGAIRGTRLSYNIPPIKVRHDYFKNSFFPSAIPERIRLTSTLETQQVSMLLKRSF